MDNRNYENKVVEYEITQTRRIKMNRKQNQNKTLKEVLEKMVSEIQILQKERDKIKTIDIALTVRSKKQFYRKSKPREILALLDPKRNKGKLADKYLRDMIIVTAHARNLGMQ